MRWWQAAWIAAWGLHSPAGADTLVGSSYTLNPSGAVCTTVGTPSGTAPVWTCHVPTASGGLALVRGVANDPAAFAPDAASLASLAASLGGQSLLFGDSTTAATGAESLALGNGAQSAGARSAAVGTGAKALGARRLALGAGAGAKPERDVALGSDAITGTAVPVASGVVGGAVYNFAGAHPVGVVSIGAPGAERQLQNVAAGRVDAGSTDAVNGSQRYATQQAPSQIALGKGSTDGPDTTNLERTVRYDTKPDGSIDHDNVSLGNGGSGGPVGLHNVAPGVAPNDAVNVQQLQAVTAAMNGRIDTLAEQVNSNTRMLSGGIAASAAMAVVTPVEPGRYHVSGAVAGYNGQAGVGFNLLKRSQDGQKTLHAGIGWGSGGGKALVRVGFGVSFD